MIANFDPLCSLYAVEKVFKKIKPKTAKRKKALNQKDIEELSFYLINLLYGTSAKPKASGVLLAKN